jgi:hypothetical protein
MLEATNQPMLEIAANYRSRKVIKLCPFFIPFLTTNEKMRKSISYPVLHSAKELPKCPSSHQLLICVLAVH